MFRAIKDEFALAENYTSLVSLAVPIYPKEYDSKLIENTSVAAQGGLLLAFLIPLLLNIVLKLEMDYVWSLYYTMQLIGNL